MYSITRLVCLRGRRARRRARTHAGALRKRGDEGRRRGNDATNGNERQTKCNEEQTNEWARRTKRRTKGKQGTRERKRNERRNEAGTQKNKGASPSEPRARTGAQTRLMRLCASVLIVHRAAYSVQHSSPELPFEIASRRTSALASQRRSGRTGVTGGARIKQASRLLARGDDDDDDGGCENARTIWEGRE